MSKHPPDLPAQLSGKINVEFGQSMLVIDLISPRGRGILGRHVKVVPGRDGLVRSAEIGSSNGLLHWPGVKLCCLAP